jgi:hypothetical protein
MSTEDTTPLAIRLRRGGRMGRYSGCREAFLRLFFMGLPFMRRRNSNAAITLGAFPVRASHRANPFVDSSYRLDRFWQ